jgi:starch synthase
MKKVLMVASEAAPFAKTGGLSDVLGALPRVLREIGIEVAVLLPRYAQTRPFPMRRIWDDLRVQLGPRTYSCSIMKSEQDESYLFLDCPELYDRAGLYTDSRGDFPDNHLRFGLLARAVFQVIRHIFDAGIIHCHDWQAGLVPVYLKRTFAGDPTFVGIKTLTTIHNLGYQGLFPPTVLGALGLPADVFQPDGLEFYGKVGFLKAGLQYSDALSTVSRRYAEEIQTPEYGFALDGLLRRRRAVLHGILNGVDYTRWNPETDPMIPAHYSARDPAGKRVCKAELLREFGLPQTVIDQPLIGVVSRFTEQKGADLIAEVGGHIFRKDACMVALGNGERKYEDMFRALALANPGRVAVSIGFNEAMAHRIEAGSDMFLMPSRYEPCGLNQIYSLKYGTVPVVRATGGLDDTVDELTGFKFAEYTGDALAEALKEAIEAYPDRAKWLKLMKNGMARDHSWGASAREYAKLYAALLNPDAG